MEAAPPTEPVPAEPKPTRRRLKRILLFFAIGAPIAAILLLAAAVLLLPVILTDEDVAREAVSALTDNLGTPAKIERVKYHPLTGIEIFGLVIGPPPGFEREVARIDRVAVLYDLSELFSARVIVNEVAIERPHLVMETKLGEDGLPFSNLDAILQHLASRSPPKTETQPPPPSPPRSGALSPIDAVLEKLSISDLSVEMTGAAGPQVALSGVSLTSHGSIDGERLSARLWLSIAPPAEANNLTLSLPANAVAAQMRLAFTASTAVEGRSSDGLDLEDTTLVIRAALDGNAAQGPAAFPNVDLDFGADLSLRPGDDQFVLASLQLVLSKATLLDLSMKIEGLSALLGELMGPPAAEKLAAQIGLEKKRPDGVTSLSARTIALPLDVLGPYASPFVPGLSATGAITLAPLELEATLIELVRGTPRKLQLELGFDQVSVAHTPSDARIGALGGRLRLARAEDGESYHLGGGLLFTALSQGGNGASKAGIDLDARVERLSKDLPGPASLVVSLRGDGIRAPPATVGRAEVKLAVAGTDLLASEREGVPPIVTTLAVTADHLHTETGTVTNDVKQLALAVELTADRLLLPAKQPIGAKIDLAVERVATSAKLAVNGTKLHVDATLSDPRAGPIDAAAALDLRVAALEHPQAALDRAHLRVGTKSRGVARRQVSGLGINWYPTSAELDLDVALPSITVHDPVNGDYTTSVALKTVAGASLVDGTGWLRSLSLDVWDVIRVRASGRGSKIFAKEPNVDLKLDVLPIDLQQLLERAPAAMVQRSMPGLRSSGKVGLAVRVKGTVPQNLAGMDLAKPPLDADVELSFEDVAALMPSRKLDLAGLAGKITLDVGQDHSQLSTDLSISKVLFLGGPSESGLAGLELKTRAGLRGGVWELVTDLDAEKAIGKTIAQEKDAAQFDIDLSYAKRGDVQLRRFDIRLPGSGLDAQIAGRLVRRAFGVLRPELVVRANVDLDRLRPIVPELGDVQGKVSANLDIYSRTDRLVDVYGVLEVDRFTYRFRNLVVDNATGRLPIDQRMALPEPIMRELVAGAEGVLGDDLERRLQELQDDFLAVKLYLDREDILLEAPRAADYQSLRPYLAEKGGRLTMSSFTLGTTVLKNVVLDGLWRSGVLRADRFAAQLWEGDILGDLAVQISGDLNVLIRMRGAVTRLNLDVPYAQAKATPREKDADDYKISGVLDTRFDLRQRTVTMKLDLTRITFETLDRLFDAMDPENKNPSLEGARSGLFWAGLAGLDVSSGQFSITQNLFSMNIDFKRPLERPIDGVVDVLAWPFRLLHTVLAVAVGPLFVGNVNGLEKLSISPWLVPPLERERFEDRLAYYLHGRVIADDLGAATADRTSSP